MATTLASSGIELDMSNVAPSARAQPTWTTKVVEYLDATAEVPKETVDVWGLLQGANSGGQGTFEIVTDATRSLDPVLGRRSPGDKVKGTLTPKARKQIGASWVSARRGRRAAPRVRDLHAVAGEIRHSAPQSTFFDVSRPFPTLAQARPLAHPIVPGRMAVRLPEPRRF